MRVKKTTQNGTVLYAWDNERIFAEYDESGNVIQETVYFGSTPIALLKGDKTYRIYADQIDTPRVITENQSNQTLWTWESKPFGETKPNEDVDGDQVALNYNLRFPGQYYDAETGKHYNFNRDYNSVTGRYMQSDPIGVDGNGYFYTTTPLLSFDSSGLYTINDAKGRLSSIKAPKRKRTRKGRRYFYSYADWQIFDEWLRLERNDRGWISKLPKCPRRISVSWWGADNPNPRVWENPGGRLTVWYFHPGASYEMRSKPVSGNHANQCTYDKNGRVIRWIPAAGSADRVSVSSSFWGHKYHDVDTFSLAEGLNRVRDYYSVRPVIIE